MEVADGGSSSSKLDAVNVKPVIVRVKRKAFQSPLEAFWLEINERPVKRPLLDFAKLSISDDSNERGEWRSTKVFLQHVETVSCSEAAINILQSFVDPDTADTSILKTKIDERKRAFKEEKKQNQLLSRSRQKHESLAKSARFEQIWNKRKGAKERTDDGSLHEKCHLYDIVRVDGKPESSNKTEKPGNMSLEESAIMSNYLSLLQEFLPSVAEQVQSGMQSHLPEQVSADFLTVSADGYVYDLYAIDNEMIPVEEEFLNFYPLVQVDDDDYFCDGPSHSDYETDDSNAEDNPLNDYPDEETEEEEDDSEEEEEEDDDDENDDDEGSSASFEILEELKSKLIVYSSDEYLEDEDELYGGIGSDDDSDEGEDDRRYQFP